MAELGTIPLTRKTRFVCISDTHNASPGGAFQLPKGDVLIHAGDLTNQGSYSELQKTIKWLDEADFEKKIIVAGNHDITLDADFYRQYGLYFHNQEPQDPAKCQRLIESSSVLWLKHESAVINLNSPSGPRTIFKVFGSPFSPAKGNWAFGYGLEEARQIWDRIPLDSDITVTHTPPKYHCDEANNRRSEGCEALREALWRIRPRLAICGHIHEGRGAERIRWDLGASNIKFKENGVEQWDDPGKDNKKQSSVDLTSRSSKPLQNDGSSWDQKLYISGNIQTPPSVVCDRLTGCPTESGPKPTAISGITQITPPNKLSVPPESLLLATKGQGGIPPSHRCDLGALSGRMGRMETYVVNAAIMASSWPHKGGGKKFNKPIVVDIDLPVSKSCQ